VTYVLKEKNGRTSVFPALGEAAEATLYAPATGRLMRVSTSLPGMHLYTGNTLPKYPRTAVCLEPQFFPDAVHHPDFPSTVLRAGEIYAHEIVYAFDSTPINVKQNL
jgi:aldose 1-epimerase